jgi:hypothetical protein
MLETLHIVTCVANPLLWQSRENLARVAISDWLKEPNVAIYLAECAYGSRGYQLADLAGPRVTHIPLRATTMAWSKENLLNIAISRLPPEARKIATLRRRHYLPPFRMGDEHAQRARPLSGRATVGQGI